MIKLTESFMLGMNLRLAHMSRIMIFIIPPLLIVTPVLLGLNPVLDMIPLSGYIMLYLKGVIYAVLLFYILRQIWKTSRDNAVLRNHIMASSILLAEMDSSEYVTTQT